MTPKQKMKKAIVIDKPYRAIALTDGWLCIKYLDGGEESLTTFADISEGDVITYGRSRPYNPQAERELWCGDCGFKKSKTCNDETTWKRCRLMSSEPEGKNVEARLELARQLERERVLDELYPPNTQITKNGDLYGGWEIDPKSLIRLKRYIKSNPQYEEEPDMEVIEVVIRAIKHELKYGKAELRQGGE